MNSERLAEKARIRRSFAKLSLSFPRNGSNAEVAGFKVFYFDRLCDCCTEKYLYGRTIG